MSRSLALAVLLMLASTAPAASITLISELLVDAPGSDNGRTFVELFGEGGASLDGYRIVGRNGANGAVTHDVDLTGWSIPIDGFFVVADAAGSSTEVANADLLVASLDFQNGPDSLELLRDGVVVDALGYGAFGPGHSFFGEGTAAPKPGAGQSLARFFANLDTNDNAADFTLLDLATPGIGATIAAPGPSDPPVAATPEPATWLLMSIGGVGLAIGRKRRGGRGARRR